MRLRRQIAESCINILSIIFGTIELTGKETAKKGGGATVFVPVHLEDLFPMKSIQGLQL